MAFSRAAASLMDIAFIPDFYHPRRPKTLTQINRLPSAAIDATDRYWQCSEPLAVRKDVPVWTPTCPCARPIHLGTVRRYSR